jgi:hypothetical protein
MTKSQNRNFNRAALALIAMSFAGALGAVAPAAATANYDGLWSVVIVTQKGTCDRSYRYPVRISNGAVQNDGPSLINVSGKVGGNGAVTVLVSAGDKSATNPYVARGSHHATRAQCCSGPARSTARFR